MYKYVHLGGNNEEKLSSDRVYFLRGVIANELSACSCRHEWTDATCTEPKVCSKCGETEGDALGHSWGELEGGKKGNCDWKWYKRTNLFAVRKDTDYILCNWKSGWGRTSFADPERFLCASYAESILSAGGTEQRAGEMVAGVTGVGGFDPNYTDGEAIAAILFSDGEVVIDAEDENSARSRYSQ